MQWIAIGAGALLIVVVVWTFLRNRRPTIINKFPEPEDELKRIDEDLEERRDEIDSYDIDTTISAANRELRRRRKKDD